MVNDIIKEKEHEMIYLESSGRYGIPLNFAIKEFKIFDLLSQVIKLMKEKDIDLVLKGGTAINKVYFGELQRFSEDIDFDDFSKGSMKERIKNLESLMKSIKGFKIGKARRYKKVIMFDCEYVTPNGQKDHVRLEFALQEKRFKPKKIVMETARFLIANATIVGIPTYSLEDLTARKLHALFERKEGKDIYDIALVIEKIEKRKLLSSLKEVLKVEKKKISPKKFIEKLISDLKNVDSKKIRNITNPYIPLANRPKEWKILIDTLIDNLEKLVK